MTLRLLTALNIYLTVLTTLAWEHHVWLPWAICLTAGCAMFWAVIINRLGNLDDHR